MEPAETVALDFHPPSQDHLLREREAEAGVPAIQVERADLAEAETAGGTRLPEPEEPSTRVAGEVAQATALPQRAVMVARV